MATADIGKSRRQRVFAVMEDTTGTLKFPTANDFIRPAGDAIVNQVPDFTDSKEKQDTLDVLDQFQKALPPAEFTVPMYVRPFSALATTSFPQGHAFFKSMQGTVYNKSSSYASLTSAMTSSVSTINYRKLTGVLPEKGVVLIGSEYVYYTGKTATNSTQGVLTGATRAYSGSAATHATGVNVLLASTFYKQASTSPSFSLWVETDHLVQGLSGCTVNSAKLSLSNEDAVSIEFTGNGMRMVWAGTSAMAARAASSATHITVDDAKIFSVGGVIQNSTGGYHNGSTGYSITAINTTTNVMTISPAISAAWATDNVICGYLPSATVIGSDPIESRYCAVKINNVAGYFKSGDLTIGVPKNYITDEIGTTYPQGYMEDVRNIESTLNLYFRQADAKYLTDGYSSAEVPILLTYGNTNTKKLEIYMKRVKIKTPKVEFSAPAVNLSIPIKALGTDGEDSLELCFN